MNIFSLDSFAGIETTAFPIELNVFYDFSLNSVSIVHSKRFDVSWLLNGVSDGSQNNLRGRLVFTHILMSTVIWMCMYLNEISFKLVNKNYSIK